jgi:serine/threonine-protein kinase
MPSKLPGRQAVLGLEGTRAGRYLLQDCLGHGSHTAVYRALTPYGERCALKFVDARLQGGEDLAERLRREAAVLDRIGNPRILPILSPMATDEATMAAVPLVAGPTLQDLMRGGGLDAEQAWDILGQLADALHSAHQWGLTYRVLKPANVLVHDGHAYLSEFGMTGRYAAQVGLASPGTRLSASQYLAPEQILGEEPDHRADIYSFAVLVFELATGTSLYDATQPSEIFNRTLNQPPPSAHARNPRVPKDVDWVLRRALARDPGARPGSVGQLIEELVYPPQPNGAHQGVVVVPGEPDPAPAAVTVESLIDVLSEVLTPGGPDRERQA